MFAYIKYISRRGHEKSAEPSPLFPSLQLKALGCPNTKIRKRDSTTLRAAASRPNLAYMKSS